jgi:hypothetical protein
MYVFRICTYVGYMYMYVSITVLSNGSQDVIIRLSIPAGTDSTPSLQQSFHFASVLNNQPVNQLPSCLQMFERSGCLDILEASSTETRRSKI